MKSVPLNNDDYEGKSEAYQAARSDRRQELQDAEEALSPELRRREDQVYREARAHRRQERLRHSLLATRLQEQETPGRAVGVHVSERDMVVGVLFVFLVSLLTWSFLPLVGGAAMGFVVLNAWAFDGNS